MKPSSQQPLKSYGGGIECIMVTGDNAMCGNYIGKGCGIFESAKDVLLGDVDVITEMFRGRLWYRMALLLKLTIQIRCCKRLWQTAIAFN